MTSIRLSNVMTNKLQHTSSFSWYTVKNTPRKSVNILHSMCSKKYTVNTQEKKNYWKA